MTKHPLNDKICREITAHMDFYNPTVQRNDMRTAADWQLEQVIKWLNENLSNYTSAPLSDSPGDLEPLFMLRGDLRQAMRPTTPKNHQ